MKYICTINDDGREEIFTFPKDVDHDAFYEVASRIKNHTWGNWHRVQREIISAGFVDMNLNCGGRSESLKVDSRGAQDTELLESQF